MSDTDRLDWLADNLAYIMLGADYTKGRTTMEILPNNGRGWKDGELRAAIDKARGAEDPSVLAAEKIRSEHFIKSLDEGPEKNIILDCSCGAHWTLNSREIKLEVRQAQVHESMRSHYISAGLKPSEVL